MNKPRFSRKDFSSIDLYEVARRVLLRYGFLPKFPSRLRRQVQQLKNRSEEGGRIDPSLRDLRELLWSSIDNLESLDLDQLEYCEQAPGREIRALVAIADVDLYVDQGSGLDRHAAHNGSSLYLGIKVFSMLPDELSTNLSSLNEGEDRLAIVIEFFVRRDGSVRAGEVFRALVHNKAKLVYESVGDWLEGKAPIPEKVHQTHGLENQLRLQDEAASRLRQYRLEKGAVELETIEPVPIIKNGKVVDLVVRHKNRARFLIENFMIAANGAMVGFLEKKGSPMIHRVVRTPERWSRIVDVAAEYGEKLPESPDPFALSEFMIKMEERDSAHFPDLSLSIVKLLGSGEYVLAEPGKPRLGHFGLSVHDYTHSTAPNRRYVDLIIQRLLKAVLVKRPTPYTKRELMDYASWCTERDQSSKKVERFMRKVLAAMLLSERLGEVFDAIVTGVSDKGTFARLMSPPAEGRIMEKEQGLDVGQKIRARLISLDPENGFIDFERVG